MPVVARAMPTIAPVDIEVFPLTGTDGAGDVAVLELDVEVAVADGRAVTVLVTTAFTRSKSEELARPRVEESFCFTQPREMKYRWPRIRPVA